MTSAIENSSRTGVFWTPPPKWETPPAATGVPVMPCSENNARRSLYHAHYKVPPGDSPYGIAKRVQLVDKDPSKAVSLFWAAINSGDRVDSALKDMAVIMKQLNRSDEAIEAIKSFRHLCPVESQESLDNVLLELYKKSGKLQEEIQMLRLKLKHIEEDVSFRGKRIKVGRSQGRKVHITIEKEYSRLLGNLAWAYLQQKDYRSAEEYYRKALSLEPDRNKQCNLAVCLTHLNKKTEARLLLQAVRTSCENAQIDDSFSRSFDRATQLLGELESDHFPKPIIQKEKMYGEIQKPFLSCARRNLRRPSEADNGNKLMGFERLGNSEVVHQDEISPVNELKTPSLLQNLHDSNITFSGSKRRNVKGTFCGGIRHSNGQKREALTCKKEYDPSFSLAKTPRVLTQPQKCLRLADKCSHGRRSYAEGPDGGCSRKLLFQHENNCENVQFSPYHNVHQYKEPESTRSLTSEDRRKKTLGDLVPKHSKCSMIAISVGVWRRDFLEVGEQRKDTKIESSLSSVTTFGGYSTRKEEFPECDEDSGRNSTVYRMGLIEAAENGNQIQKSTQKLKSNVDNLQDFPTSKKKKSWADMVEEDDQELLNESKDSLAHEQGFPSGESVVSPKNTPINHSHDNEAGEQFGDENRNPDIILETPCSLNQGESLNQKLKSLVPKDGYYTQPLHSGSSTNLTGRRLFCYDQYRNLDKIQTTFVSPLQKRSLNFI